MRGAEESPGANTSSRGVLALCSMVPTASMWLAEKASETMFEVTCERIFQDVPDESARTRALRLTTTSSPCAPSRYTSDPGRVHARRHEATKKPEETRRNRRPAAVRASALPSARYPPHGDTANALAASRRWISRSFAPATSHQTENLTSKTGHVYGHRHQCRIKQQRFLKLPQSGGRKEKKQAILPGRCSVVCLACIICP